jgi:hypothetical protein
MSSEVEDYLSVSLSLSLSFLQTEVNLTGRNGGAGSCASLGESRPNLLGWLLMLREGSCIPLIYP